ncbi:MAG: type II toxin-antitoxin system VapB family antitoxin [Deltaproteobacteria bacterium]|nr:type II toxin-antitoxin system VapB family antitoxin [Deltaproteobacteria bacterium]
MKAKVFRSGNSQAVRLPKEFQLDVREVEVFKRGGEVVLRPMAKSWEYYCKHGRRFTDDFPDRIEDLLAEERRCL